MSKKKKVDKPSVPKFALDSVETSADGDAPKVFRFKRLRGDTATTTRRDFLRGGLALGVGRPVARHFRDVVVAGTTGTLRTATHPV